MGRVHVPDPIGHRKVSVSSGADVEAQRAAFARLRRGAPIWRPGHDRREALRGGERLELRDVDGRRDVHRSLQARELDAGTADHLDSEPVLLGRGDAAARQPVRVQVRDRSGDDHLRLESGELDGSYDLPFSAIPQLSDSSTGTLYYGNSWEQDGVLVATTKGPTTNPLVRQALSLAIDRSGIAQTAFYGKAAPSKWMFPPSAYGSTQTVFQQAYASLPDNTHPDIAAAKKLVAQAGTPKQEMVVAAESGSPESQDVATELTSAANQIGLNMKIRVLSPAAFDNAVFTPRGAPGSTSWWASAARCSRHSRSPAIFCSTTD